MLATVINVILVLLGSALGLIFKNRISARFSSGLMFALGLCVLGIGISNMIRTNDTLCVIICMVLGTLLGEGLNIEKRMDGLGGVLRRKLIRGEGNNRFVEGIAPEIVTEMSAVGGTIIVGIGINMLGLPKEKIRVGNMLPAIFLPLVYLPAAQWLSGLIG